MMTCVKNMLYFLYFSAISIFQCDATIMGRIAGGTTATAGQAPYMVSVQSTVTSDAVTMGHKCGGTLLRADNVLTAASCVTYTNVLITTWLDDSPNLYRVAAGGTSLTTDMITSLVTAITPHPDYSKTTKDADIAILLLTTPFETSVDIQPILYATTEPVTDATCLFAGWGGSASYEFASVTLNVLLTSVADQTECATTYAALQTVNTNMVCAASPDGNSPCATDVGGPLVCSNAVTGVLSWGDNCGQLDTVPSVYTRVSTYSTWILSIIGDLANKATKVIFTAALAVAIGAIISY